MDAHEKLKKLLEEIERCKYGTKNRAELILKIVDLIELTK